MKKDKDISRLFYPQDIITTPITSIEGRESCIRLDLNEPQGFIDKAFLSKIRKLDSFIIESYPEYQSLIQKIARFHDVKPENICLFDGSDQAITHIVRLFFRKKDKVLLPSPTFAIYNQALALIETKPITPCYVEIKNTFAFPYSEVLKILNNKNIRGVLLCNPNNPLGSTIPPEKIEIIAKKTEGLGIPLVIDEAYIPYSKEESALSIFKKYKNLIIIRTFSKAYGVPGIRLGYTITNKEVSKALSVRKLPWNANHIAVFTGLTILKNYKDFKQKQEKLMRNKKVLEEFLCSLPVRVYSTETNFSIFRVKDSKYIESKLRKKGILVKNLTNYPESSDLLENTIRMTTPSVKNIPIVKKALKEVLSSK